MKRLTFPILFILCALMLAAAAGCGDDTSTTTGKTGTGTSSSGSVTSGVTRINEGQSGATIGISVGELLVVTLSSNPTTGYHWVVSSNTDDTVLAQQGEPVYTPDPGSEGLMGAGGKDTFTFSGMGEGVTELKMAYLSPSNEPSGTTFNVKVNVD